MSVVVFMVMVVESRLELSEPEPVCTIVNMPFMFPLR
jgi:hypothetical protein